MALRANPYLKAGSHGGLARAAVTTSLACRIVCPSRICSPQARRAVEEELRGLELGRHHFERGDLVVLMRDRRPQVITGATRWRVNGLGDLKLITPAEVMWIPKSRWSYLLCANTGILRDRDDFNLLLVAVQRRAA